jgi:hypothetical protein
MNPTGDDNRWIIVPGWGKFQVAGLHRRPTWIRLYTELLHKDEFRSLTLAERGALMTIWLGYAETRGRLTVRQWRRYCPRRAPYVALEALSHAGFIRLSTALDVEKEIEEGLSPIVRAGARPRDPDAELLSEALNVAADWQGGPSETFDSELDTLERKYGLKLAPSQRMELWDVALRREKPTEERKP